MALVEVDPVDDALDRLVEGAVVEDDVRGLAAELERELHARARELALDRLADLGRAGERDLVEVGVLDEVRSGRAVARDDVDDARRAAPAWRQMSVKMSAVSGVVSAGLSTTVFPHASAGAIFHASISSGKFHGMICPATPSGRGLRFGNAYSSLSAQPA